MEPEVDWVSMETLHGKHSPGEQSCQGDRQQV